jgi:hypothetical protein
VVATSSFAKWGGKTVAKKGVVWQKLGFWGKKEALPGGRGFFWGWFGFGWSWEDCEKKF